MKLGILTGIWHLTDGTGLLKRLDRVRALGFQYMEQHIFKETVE